VNDWRRFARAARIRFRGCASDSRWIGGKPKPRMTPSR
jgi:hypothetical protein